MMRDTATLVRAATLVRDAPLIRDTDARDTDAPCEGDTETRPLVYEDIPRQR